MNYKVTRKAILIGCPGSNDNFLQGVDRDLDNVKRFLLSDKGGRWFDNEITTLRNPNYLQVLSTVQSAVADYTFIYFSGHGWTSEFQDRMLVLRDYPITDITLLNESPRQLIVVDACRNYIAPGIAGVPDYGELWEHFDGYYEIRELFNRQILNSPLGKTIIHATQAGKYSYDSSRGGYFTQALLQISTKIKVTNDYAPIHITRLLGSVRSELLRQDNDQIPEVTYSVGNMTVPFTIGIPQRTYQRAEREEPKRQYATSSNSSSGGGWLALGVALVVIGIIASNSE